MKRFKTKATHTVVKAKQVVKNRTTVICLSAITIASLWSNAEWVPILLWIGYGWYKMQ